MGALFLGAFALIGLLLLLRGFVGADVKALMKALRYSGATALLLAAIGLAALDRVGLAMLVGSFAWGLFTGGHAWPGGWPYWFPGGGSRSGSGSASGSKTRVTTDWLDMELDHNSGEMGGQVRKGAFAGRSLDTLSRDEAAALYEAASIADPESGRLLDAFLARKFGAQWRMEGESEARHNRARDTGMSRAEALRVLGLEPGADEVAIRAAHRRLILQNHPDHGGSSYLAAQINEAKDVLLNE
jgi:hypothetical protein